MDIKQILAAAIKAAAQKAIDEGTVKGGELPEVLLEVPPQKEFGDFATNFAMQSARALKCNPRMIAQAVVDNLDCAYVEKMEIAGPGFINFYLKQDWMYDMLAGIIAEGENYGNLVSDCKEKIQLEYVSANPTGPLHVGHGRGAAVGSALANLMKAAGMNVSREYYINDAGNQINNLAASVNARYLEKLGQTVEFPENGYHGYDIIETAERIVRIYGDKFLNMSEEERLQEFRTIALKENQISKPVKTQFGWHIIKREALRKSEVKPFAEVEKQLIAFLKAQKEQELMKNYIDSLEKKAKVKILVPQSAPMMLPGM